MNAGTKPDAEAGAGDELVGKYIVLVVCADEKSKTEEKWKRKGFIVDVPEGAIVRFVGPNLTNDDRSYKMSMIDYANTQDLPMADLVVVEFCPLGDILHTADEFLSMRNELKQLVINKVKPGGKVVFPIKLRETLFYMGALLNLNHESNMTFVKPAPSLINTNLNLSPDPDPETTLPNIKDKPKFNPKKVINTHIITGTYPSTNP